MQAKIYFFLNFNLIKNKIVLKNLFLQQKKYLYI